MTDLKTTLNSKRKSVVEHYETLNQLKQEWDSLNTQHQTLSQRYVPSNIEVGLNSFLVATTKNENSYQVQLISGKSTASCSSSR